MLAVPWRSAKAGRGFKVACWHPRMDVHARNLAGLTGWVAGWLASLTPPPTWPCQADSWDRASCSCVLSADARPSCSSSCLRRRATCASAAACLASPLPLQKHRQPPPPPA